MTKQCNHLRELWGTFTLQLLGKLTQLNKVITNGSPGFTGRLYFDLLTCMVSGCKTGKSTTEKSVSLSLLHLGHSYCVLCLWEEGQWHEGRLRKNQRPSFRGSSLVFIMAISHLYKIVSLFGNVYVLYKGSESKSEQGWGRISFLYFDSHSKYIPWSWIRERWTSDRCSSTESVSVKPLVTKVFSSNLRSNLCAQPYA